MNTKPRLLVVDDELPIRRFLRASIPDTDFEIEDAATGGEGIRLIKERQFDVLLLDLGLPDIDGIEVTRIIRRESSIPIIVLSARGRESDKVAALDAGADDYLTKPFGVNELLARIRAALRRLTDRDAPSLVTTGELALDLAAHTVRLDGVEVHLTPNEYKFLALLARHAGMVVTQKQILREVWGAEYENETHYLRLYMNQLRAKLESEPARPKLLLTEPGVGYRLNLVD